MTGQRMPFHYCGDHFFQGMATLRWRNGDPVIDKKFDPFTPYD